MELIYVHRRLWLRRADKLNLMSFLNNQITEGSLHWVRIHTRLVAKNSSFHDEVISGRASWYMNKEMRADIITWRELLLWEAIRSLVLAESKCEKQNHFPAQIYNENYINEIHRWSNIKREPVLVYLFKVFHAVYPNLILYHLCTVYYIHFVPFMYCLLYTFMFHYVH